MRMKRREMSRVKMFVYRVCEVCEEPEASNVFMTWLIGYLIQNGFAFKVDERDGSTLVYEVVRSRDVAVRDMFDFVVGRGWDVAYAAYLIGAYVRISVCNESEEECVNLYLSDLRRVERDELPIVEL